MCRFANGSMGLFESTRYARGHKALKTFELNGADGSLKFDLTQPEWLDFFEYRNAEDGRKVASHIAGWRRIHVTSAEHPYMAPLVGARPDHRLRAQLHPRAGRLPRRPRAAASPPSRTSATALQTQKVCDAVLRSAKAGAWEATGVEI